MKIQTNSQLLSALDRLQPEGRTPLCRVRLLLVGLALGVRDRGLCSLTLYLDSLPRTSSPAFRLHLPAFLSSTCLPAPPFCDVLPLVFPSRHPSSFPKPSSPYCLLTFLIHNLTPSPTLVIPIAATLPYAALHLLYLLIDVVYPYVR